MMTKFLAHATWLTATCVKIDGDVLFCDILALFAQMSSLSKSSRSTTSDTPQQCLVDAQLLPLPVKRPRLFQHYRRQTPSTEGKCTLTHSFRIVTVVSIASKIINGSSCSIYFILSQTGICTLEIK